MSTIRYVGIDIHKRHVTIAAVNAQQRPMLSPQKVTVARFDAWASTHLLPSDHVALEATTNAWAFYDKLQPIVAEVSVANTHKLRLIGSSASKTDKHDASVLAKLLAAHLLPAIWIPPVHVRHLRSLTSHRTQLIHQRTATKNRLHALLHQHNRVAPTDDPFCAANETWWAELPLSHIERLQLRHYWLIIHHLNQLLNETEAELAQLSATASWGEAMTFLMQLPGVGLYTGMTILAAIGDITRFPSPQQLVGYAGLGARVHASGDTYHTGKISKQGRRELRTTLIMCAWVAVRWSDHWGAVFHSLAKRIGRHKAITAVARKLLVVIWHVLTKRQLDRHADVHAIARSFMRWSELHHLARSQGLRRLDFVKQRLDRLGILRQVSSFRANGRTYFVAFPLDLSNN